MTEIVERVKTIIEDHANQVKIRAQADRRINELQKKLQGLSLELTTVSTRQQAQEAMYCAVCGHLALAYSDRSLCYVATFFYQTVFQRAHRDCKHVVCYGCSVKPDNIVLKQCPKCQAQVDGLLLGHRKDTIKIQESLDSHQLRCPYDHCESLSGFSDLARHIGICHLKILSCVRDRPKQDEYLPIWF